MIIVAIDPGLRHSGMAVFDSGELVWAGLVRSSEATARGPRAWAAMAKAAWEAFPLAADVLVIEMPQYDSRTRIAGPDVMEVVGVVGKTMAEFVGVDWMVPVTPAQWKGQVPKEVQHARLKEQLTAEECAQIEDAGSLTHNILDAVALGRWYLKWHQKEAA